MEPGLKVRGRLRAGRVCVVVLGREISPVTFACSGGCVAIPLGGHAHSRGPGTDERKGQSLEAGSTPAMANGDGMILWARRPPSLRAGLGTNELRRITASMQIGFLIPVDGITLKGRCWKLMLPRLRLAAASGPPRRPIVE